MELVKSLGERIRYLRKQKNLSQEQLGELADIHTNYVGAIERGEKNITIESLIKVSRGLGVTLEELLRYIEPMNDKEDGLHKIIQLLTNRSKDDHALVLKLIETIFEWENEKHL
ncbi:helix-turn-helix domain-containing protein [Metabacillus litoralis]|uniref:helix-turn-helix domain-containing protein n=1 Tax=Metabacillus litoralis TaxID=152268 RepID=UPI00203C7AAC|nr:helix-turn-helix transcriptional regulator [Metabacillus litoralis]MCM3412653.1 helix-turn-helix domain-containing protein [Metabacillus litoralis]